MSNFNDLYDHVAADRSRAMQLLGIQDIRRKAVAELLAAGAYTEPDNIDDMTDAEREQHKAEAAYGLGRPHILEAAKMPVQDGDETYAIAVTATSERPNCIALCIQTKLEELYMSGIVERSATHHPRLFVVAANDRPDEDVQGLSTALDMLRVAYPDFHIELSERTPEQAMRAALAEDLRDALDKLKLNDASLSYEPETSIALGYGFRCGFLGMLHMEVIQERLEREFDLDLVTTLPSVIYEVYKTDGTMVRVDNPHNYPDPAHIEHAEEPYVKVTIVTPPDYVGNIMPMCQDRRGEFKDMQYLDTYLVEMHYEMPLNEIIYDFFDTLKANTKGYASLDYELSGYRPSELVKVDILLNGDQVDALSFIAHRDKAYARARKLCEKLKDNIPRQLFEIPIQAAIGGRIIARETVKAMRKDVLAKCYGGDISRKKKLLEKQKEGKKKMRSLGTVQVPTEAFLAVLKLDE